MDDKIMSKKAQVTMWVIIAVVLVASILVFFLLRRAPEVLRLPEAGVVNTQSILSSCISKHTLNAVDIMLPKGGFLNPTNAKAFNGTQIAYICLNVGSFYPCVNQHPMLLREMESEIKGYITPFVADCLTETQREAAARQANMTFGNEPTEFDVELKSGKVEVVVNRSLRVNKNGQEARYNQFKIDVPSPAYDLASVVNEIADQEAKYCYFETGGYSAAYPRYDVNVYRTAEGTKIYTINDKKTGEYMMTAIRGCVIPPGVG